MSCPAVLAHVYQAFLHNPQHLAANPLWHVQFVEIGNESRVDSRLALKPLDRIFQDSEQTLRVHVDSLHLLHQFPQLQHFFAQQPLNSSQFPVDRPVGLGLTAHYVYLHLHSNEGLHCAIMQFSRKPGSLRRQCAPPQPVQKVHVIHRRPHLPHHVQQETQFLLFFATPLGIVEEYPSPPLPSREKRNRYQRIKTLRLPQFHQRRQIRHRHRMTRVIQRQCRPIVSPDRGVTYVSREIFYIRFDVPWRGLQPFKLGSRASTRLAQFPDEHPLAVHFLRGNHSPRCPVHRQQFPEDLLHRACQTRFHPHPRKHSGHQRFFRAQMLLLLGQVPQQNAHYDQINREHEEPLRLEVSHINVQTRQGAQRQRTLRPDVQHNETFDPKQHRFSYRGP